MKPHFVVFDNGSLCNSSGSFKSSNSSFNKHNFAFHERITKEFGLKSSNHQAFKLNIVCIVGNSSLMPIPEENSNNFSEKNAKGNANPRNANSQKNDRIKKEAYSKQNSFNSFTNTNPQIDRKVWRRLPLTKRPDYSADLKLIEQNEETIHKQPVFNAVKLKNRIVDRAMSSSTVSDSNFSNYDDNDDDNDLKSVDGIVSLTLPFQPSPLSPDQLRQNSEPSLNSQYSINLSQRKSSADSQLKVNDLKASASIDQQVQDNSRTSTNESASTSSSSSSSSSFPTDPSSFISPSNNSFDSPGSIEFIKAAIVNALERRNTETAWKLTQNLKSMEAFPCNRSFSRLVAQLCHKKEFRKSYSLYSQFHNKHGLCLDEDAFGLLVLTAAKTDGQQKLAVDLLNAMLSANHRPRVSTWSAVVSQLSRNYDSAHLSLQIFDQMISLSTDIDCPMRADCGACNAALNAAVTVMDMERAEHIFHVIMPSMHILADFRTYNILIKGFALDGQTDRMFDLIKSMKKAGVSPDVSTYNSLVCAYVGLNDMETAETIVREMKATSEPHLVKLSEPNVRTYSALIKGYVDNNQVERARMIMEEMLSNHNCFPNEYSFCNLLKGYVRAENMEMAEITFDSMRAKDIPTNAVTYNTMLTGYCQLDRMDKALELYERMRKDGVHPTVTTFNILIDGCTRSNDVRSASEIFRQMSTAGIAPSVETYTTLIKAFASVDQPQLAAQVFDEMMGEDADVAADLSSWNAMIHCYARCGMMKEAKSLFKHLKTSGLFPNLATYGCLVKGYLRHGLASEALVIWREIRERLAAQGERKLPRNRWKSKERDDGKFLTVDEPLLDDLVQICVRAGYFQRALEIVSFMEEIGISANRLKYKKMFIELEYSYTKNENNKNNQYYSNNNNNNNNNNNMYKKKARNNFGSENISLKSQGLEAFKFWLGLPNSYYSQNWDWYSEK